MPCARWAKFDTSGSIKHWLNVINQPVELQSLQEEQIQKELLTFWQFLLCSSKINENIVWQRRLHLYQLEPCVFTVTCTILLFIHELVALENWEELHTRSKFTAIPNWQIPPISFFSPLHHHKAASIQIWRPSAVLLVKGSPHEQSVWVVYSSRSQTQSSKCLSNAFYLLFTHSWRLNKRAQNL